MDCLKKYKSGFTQDLKNKATRKYLNMLIKEYGGLPANAASEFKRGFKKGFMTQCKKRNAKTRRW